MSPLGFLGLLLVAAALIAVLRGTDQEPPSRRSPSESSRATSSPAESKTPASERPEGARPRRAPTATSGKDQAPDGRKQPGDQLVQRNVTIRDLDGRVVFRGNVDLEPTLRRIDDGKRLPFRNDGATFENRERRLPAKPRGYYREYVHPTPDLSGPGPQRVVIGKEGEVHYTFDHYRTFRRVR